jgi:hypothetical protein
MALVDPALRALYDLKVQGLPLKTLLHASLPLRARYSYKQTPTSCLLGESSEM